MKMRHRVVMKPHRGEIVVQKWPKLRGKTLSPRQQAWINRFSLWACIVKAPDADSYNRAVEWAKGTGWYWRDVLMAAMAGNLIETPGEIKITTPTVYLDRTSTLALAAGAQTPVPMSSAQWDNNNFWAATPNPSRVVIKAPGLYIFGGRGNFNNTSADANRQIFARLNGVTNFPSFTGQDIANIDVLIGFVWIWYMHADDYIELMAVSGNATDLNNAQLWAVAITPEAIIP